MHPTSNGGATGKGLTGDGDAAGESPTGDGDATSEGPTGNPPALAMLLPACMLGSSQPACETPAPGRFPKASQMTGLFTKAGRKEKP